MKLLILLMVIWNLITFFMMGLDKWKAKKEKQRIPERTLIECSFIMGAIGIGAGMLAFHHKTRKLKFQILVPLSLVVNGLVIYGLVALEIV
ncbi:MAG: DUF1294 domain-containing protein [Firmicutes bacterium]|nr:DUF1294 domain-containing protein [Bacillota bacterium]